ncbi:uncharacterized protein CDV56_101040 [Aspergillus thermomutatus]|uniref:Uncharacterized protein n=1 Tax=Aspergillus thermomutatus TaxID=41047 RepID=A0A397GH49_ASPTH|nr:uncharacterized protein CDV56_101040 [Aspergillus thermomutatus]RHZ48746.1 hypothetical protein CDV56_101040 [Aspergillus thermomutatus]
MPEPRYEMRARFGVATAVENAIYDPDRRLCSRTDYWIEGSRAKLMPQWTLAIFFMVNEILCRGSGGPPHRMRVLRQVHYSVIGLAWVTSVVSAFAFPGKAEAAIHKVAIAPLALDISRHYAQYYKHYAPQMESKGLHGLSEHIAAGNNDSRKRKRKTKDDEEAAYIPDDLRSGERVLYLQEVPKVKVSHCRAWNCMPRRRTGEPIIQRVEYYHISCFERIVPDLPDLLGGGFKMDGWIAAPPGSKVSIESSTKAIQDWFRYEGRAFDIDCYERLKKDHGEWLDSWSNLHIEHQLAHSGKPSEGCCLCEEVAEPGEPKAMDYFPESPSAISLSRLLAIVSAQPHIDRW